MSVITNSSINGGGTASTILVDGIEYITSSEGALIPLQSASVTLTEMLALSPTSNGISVWNETTASWWYWNLTSSLWFPVGHEVLVFAATATTVAAALQIVTGVTANTRLYTPSITVPANLLRAGCKVVVDTRISRGSATNATIAYTARYGSLDTVSDPLCGPGQTVAATANIGYSLRHEIDILSTTAAAAIGSSTAYTESALATNVAHYFTMWANPTNSSDALALQSIFVRVLYGD